MRDFVPIIIIQTSDVALQECKAELLKAKFSDEDYFITGSPELAARKISLTDRQMLVTGSFYGEERPANFFSRRMKKKNPNLLIAKFTIVKDSKLRPPFDLIISKSCPKG